MPLASFALAVLLSLLAGVVGPSQAGSSARQLHTEVHTYFVAGKPDAAAIWVHNDCRPDTLAAAQKFAETDSSLSGLRKAQGPAEFGITGSTAEGIQRAGPTHTPTGKLWNSADFDIDYYFRNDILHGAARKAVDLPNYTGPFFRRGEMLFLKLTLDQASRLRAMLPDGSRAGLREGGGSIRLMHMGERPGPQAVSIWSKS